jgi:acyl-CoA thioesterase
MQIINTPDTTIEKIKDDFNSQAYCKLLGIEIINIGEDIARLSLQINQNHLNQNGFVHGGIISSVADSAAAVALLSNIDAGRNVSTIELKINFLRPVQNYNLFADAKIIHKGSKIAVVDIAM